ncbi:MAG: hypothetical protein ACLU3N_12410 [Lachnospiraceae bacterium]
MLTSTQRQPASLLTEEALLEHGTRRMNRLRTEKTPEIIQGLKDGTIDLIATDTSTQY